MSRVALFTYNAFKTLVGKVADLVSNGTGYAAVRDWTASSRRGERVIDLPSYTQVDSYSCGAVARFQVVKAIYPEVEFADFYEEVNPDPQRGA